MKKKYRLLIIMLLFLSVFSLPEEIFKDILPGRGLLFDRQGNMYMDFNTTSIYCYSPTGKLMCKIGQKGEGPGDIKSLGWFALHPQGNIIYVTEFVNGNKWISMFSTEGKFLGEWKCEIDRQKYGGLTAIKFDSKGNVFIQTYKLSFKPYKDFLLGTIENILLKLSPQGKIVKELYKFTTDFNAEKGGKGNITIPFHNYLFWTLNDDKLYIRENHADHINVFDVEGKRLKSIPLPFKREKVKKKDLEEWEEWLKATPWVRQGIAAGWFDLNYWKERLPFPKLKPVSGSFMFHDSKGNLYSQKYEGHQQMFNRWAKINVINNETKILEFKPGEVLLGIWENYFFFARYDQDGDYIIVKFDEKEMFKKE